MTCSGLVKGIENLLSMKLSNSCQSVLSRYFFVSLILPLLLLCGAPLTRAQEQDDVIRTETNLVQLNVGVVDPQGRAITSLSQGDFTVYEDGVKQRILHFDPANSPFSLVLLL